MTCVLNLGIGAHLVHDIGQPQPLARPGAVDRAAGAAVAERIGRRAEAALLGLQGIGGAERHRLGDERVHEAVELAPPCGDRLRPHQPDAVESRRHWPGMRSGAPSNGPLQCRRRPAFRRHGRAACSTARPSVGNSGGLAQIERRVGSAFCSGVRSASHGPQSDASCSVPTRRSCAPAGRSRCRGRAARRPRRRRSGRASGRRCAAARRRTASRWSARDSSDRHWGPATAAGRQAAPPWPRSSARSSMASAALR